MQIRRKRSHKKIGLPPGTVVFTGERRMEAPRITVTRYGPDHVDEKIVENSSSITRPAPDEDGVTWINVDGLHDTTLLNEIGTAFAVHPLALEDVASVRTRPHAADYDGQLFTSLRMLSWQPGEEEGDETVGDEHLSLLLGPNWLLTFQEQPGDVFGHVRERMMKSGSRLRTHGADYLWYALFDAVVDHYVITVGALAERADTLEEHVWADSGEWDIPAAVQATRRESLVVRKALRPLRETIDRLMSDPPPEITPFTTVFLRDLKEHILELNDSLEAIRDTLTAVMEAHLSQVSMRANEVMKVLTIVATIFIPLTFVAGIYGMNFEVMPELGWRWGYAIIWGIMLTLGGIMLALFRRKGWL